MIIQSLRYVREVKCIAIPQVRYTGIWRLNSNGSVRYSCRYLGGCVALQVFATKRRTQNQHTFMPRGWENNVNQWMMEGIMRRNWITNPEVGSQSSSGHLSGYTPPGFFLPSLFKNSSQHPSWQLLSSCSLLNLQSYINCPSAQEWRADPKLIQWQSSSLLPRWQQCEWPDFSFFEDQI